MLERLVAVADLAAGTGVALVPTLFTGHMSGVNWIPAWALGGSERDDRFRVVSGGRVERGRAPQLVLGPARRPSAGACWRARRLPRWPATTPFGVGPRQRELELRDPAEPVVGAGGGCAQIVRRSATADPDARLTLGLHMEDLENDRVLGPREASEACDVLSMHGYPIYARWADGPTDEQLLPFLADVTRWLAGGRDVLFAEFGLPTFRRGDPVGDGLRLRSAARSSRSRLPRPTRERALAALRGAGCVGAMLWCYSDYDPAIWESPAARPRRPRALVRALASRRLAQALPSPSWRRSPARGDSPDRRIPVDRSRTRGVPRRPGRAAATPLRSLSHERAGRACGIEVVGLAPRTLNWQPAARTCARTSSHRDTKMWQIAQLMLFCVGVRSSVVAAEAFALLFSCSIWP